MTTLDKIPNIVCFGEVLWDILPTYKQIGGAPLNVAFNLMKMGANATIITKIGNDELGQKIIHRFQEINFPIDQCQIDSNYNTGTVFAFFDENNEACYDFLENSAWDNIEYRQQDLIQVQQAEAFVFGSLACRSPKSQSTLLKLIEVAKYKVFDINLRAPHYNLQFIIDMMHVADLIKMNNVELRSILEHLGQPFTTENDAICYIQAHFKCDEVLVTKGSKGGLYANKKTIYHFPSVEIVVKDTIGSGDAFLAGFLASKLFKSNNIDALKKGAALGAFITSQAGACPNYKLEDFMLFYEENIFEDDKIKIIHTE